VGQTAEVAFGQQAGPPASASQLRELLALLQQAGHADFRDARGPMGFTQRQAAGKFTRDEAQGLIDQLLEAEHQASDGGSGDGGADAGAAEAPVPAAVRQKAAATDRRAAEQARSLRSISDEVLAAELQRRGWAVVQP
jgi:hypothetical protein